MNAGRFLFVSWGSDGVGYQRKMIFPLNTYKIISEIGGYAGNASVTEMEILHALIDPFHKNQPRDEDKKEEYYEPVKHAFFYLRDDSYLKSLPSSPDLLRKTYTNESEENLVRTGERRKGVERLAGK